MEIVDKIPVELDTKELIRTQKLGRVGEDEVEALVEKARQLIEPKAIYTLLEVADVHNDEVQLKGGNSFKSIVLADKVKKGQTVAVYVVTIGSKLEKNASEVAKSSILQSFILEKIADSAISKARDYVKGLVEEKLGGRVSSFGPGTGTGKLFDIKQQEILFQILDPVKNIGVQLSPSYLMIPRKSVSGVFALIEVEYVTCQYCPKKCDGRKKGFIGEYRTIKCEHELH
jgi:hypothetical protein